MSDARSGSMHAVWESGLPQDAGDAVLLGRSDAGQGPAPGLVCDDEVFDLSAAAPTVSDLQNRHVPGALFQGVVTSATYPSLRGKRVVVTGGGSGIGAAIVEAFARQGAQVIFLDVADSDSRALEQRLSDAPHAPKYLRCDLCDLQAVKRTFVDIGTQLGTVDVLINNAANDDRHRIVDITEAYWDERIAVNLRHLLFCAQAVAPGMKAAGAGAIINFGSISWHLALPDLVLYQTAKAAIEGMTRALARDLGEHNIRVTCVVPGGIRTPRQMKLWHNPEEERRMLAQQCLKQRVDPEHVAAMVLFLASDDGRMCTGHEYFVDAGWR